MSLAELTNKFYTAAKRFKSYVIFEQERIGIEGRPFTIYKFRTMRRGSEGLYAKISEENGTDRFGHIANDPRVIPVIGPFLRFARLDEMPNFYNLFKGDMALVGPRPIPYCEHESLPAEQRALRERFKPGIIPINLFADFLKIHSAEDLRASDHRYNIQRLNDPLTPLRYFISALAVPIRYMKTLYNTPQPLT